METVPTDSPADRMAYWKGGNELLLASPLKSRVIRFDADTLESRGIINSIFGVRTLAIDPIRNLLFCGSLTSGTVPIYDLATGQRRISFYLGPWLRTIAIHPSSGTAYVSSNGALYKLSYGHLR